MSAIDLLEQVVRLATSCTWPSPDRGQVHTGWFLTDQKKRFTLYIWVLHGLHIKAPKKEGLNLCSFPIVCQTESEFFLENEFKHFCQFLMKTSVHVKQMNHCNGHCM